MEKPSLFDRLNNWARHSVTLKLFAIGFLILLLLIPSAMITSLIHERESTRNEAVNEVSSKWGNSQEISGPVISVPYIVYSKDKDGNTSSTIYYAHFLPDRIKIDGTLTPEKRYRGIYVVVLYNARLHITGSFSRLNTAALHIAESNFIYKDAILSMGISDMKGIRQQISVKLNNGDAMFEPGINTHDLFSSGISMPVTIDSAGMTFDLNVDINGSSSISFMPLGKETDVTLASTWANPSFEGNFLPEKRDITDNGFTASWRVLEMNRNFPQQGTGSFIHQNRNDYDADHISFGVKLLLPVDEYQKTMRSAKYCLMFIIITFLSFFFVEIFTGKRMHPIQYLLVGFAVVLFYVLLLSVSEHISFNLAYWLSCLMILLLVTFYAWAVFRKASVAMLIFILLGLLYGFFYSLLQLQDYALLMGSLGLLLILAAIMFLTRNIDWYSLSQRKKELD